MSARRIAAAAALGYVALAAIEGMEIAEAPDLASSAAEIRGFYDDRALAWVTTTAGAISLALYASFAVLLGSVLDEGRRHRRAVAVMRAGGVGAAAAALIGLAAASGAAGIGGDALADDRVTDLFRLGLAARILAAPLAAAFLIAAGVAGRRSRVLPEPLCAAALAIGAILAAAALAAALGAGERAVTVAFGLQVLWVLAAGLWLRLADGGSAMRFARRASFLVLAIAAGLIGLALLAVPGATGQYFAWGLGPPPLAAFAGGVYLGSALTYALAIDDSETDVRGLVLGAAVLSTSVLAFTLAHLDQFDFDRLQAWAWVVLFAGFTALFWLLFVRAPDAPEQPAANRRSRVALGVVTVALAVLAGALWIDPGALAGPWPFELSPLGGRFAGSWVALLATLAGWAALGGRRRDAEHAGVALMALGLGAIVAAARTIGDLEPAAGAIVYLLAIALVCLAGWVALAGRRAGTPAV